MRHVCLKNVEDTGHWLKAVHVAVRLLARSRSCLKVKRNKRQEFVIAGYTDSSNGLPGFGALILGVYEEGRSIYYRPRSLGNGQYTVDHSSYIYVIDPKGKFVELLTGDLPGHPLVEDLRKLEK